MYGLTIEPRMLVESIATETAAPPNRVAKGVSELTTEAVSRISLATAAPPRRLLRSMK